MFNGPPTADVLTPPPGPPGVAQALEWLEVAGARFILLSPQDDYHRPRRGVKWSQHWPSTTEAAIHVEIVDPVTGLTDPRKHHPIGIEPASLQMAVLDIDRNVGDAEALPSPEAVAELIRRHPPAAITGSRTPGRYHLWYHDPLPPGETRNNNRWTYLGLTGEIRGTMGVSHEVNITSLVHQLRTTPGYFPFPIFDHTAPAHAPPASLPQTPSLGSLPPSPVSLHHQGKEAQQRDSGTMSRQAGRGGQTPPPEAFGSWENASSEEFRALRRLFLPDSMPWRVGHGCCLEDDNGNCGRKGNRHLTMVSFITRLLAMPRNWPTKRSWEYRELIGFSLVVNASYAPPLPAVEVFRIVRDLYHKDNQQADKVRQELLSKRQTVKGLYSGIRRAITTRAKARGLRMRRAGGVETKTLVRRSGLPKTTVYRWLRRGHRAHERKQDRQACRALYALGVLPEIIAKKGRWTVGWVWQVLGLTDSLEKGEERPRGTSPTPAPVEAQESRTTAVRAPPRKEG